ncbi:MAG: methionyl-tRNA formyltransferase [Candidatus Gracilibacteria bacterium]|jgi:methionyl-tRNA formyltransferase
MTPERLKIIFMGTPEIAVPCLESLYNCDGFEISAVVTQEDKKVGRKQEIEAPPVKIWALKHNLPVLQPPIIKNNKEFLKVLKALNPDFIVVIAFGKILPEEVLNLPKYDSINIHVSLLPKYRGASPIEEALLNGDKETGISIMKMEEKLDTGPIYFVKKLQIEPEDNAETLRIKLSLLAGAAIPIILKEISEGNLKAIPQNESKATHCHKITKEDGLINLQSMGAEEIDNRIKAYTPWPACHLFIENKRFKILEAKIDLSKNEESGKVIDIDKNSIAIGTKKGLLIPLKVQLEGKPAMDIQDFLLGNRKLLKNSLVNPK